MVSSYCFVTKACARRPGAAASVQRRRRERCTLLAGAGELAGATRLRQARPSSACTVSASPNTCSCISALLCQQHHFLLHNKSHCLEMCLFVCFGCFFPNTHAPSRDTTKTLVCFYVRHMDGRAESSCMLSRFVQHTSTM